MKRHTTGCKPTHTASLPTVSDLVSDGRESGAVSVAGSRRRCLAAGRRVCYRRRPVCAPGARIGATLPNPKRCKARSGAAARATRVGVGAQDGRPDRRAPTPGRPAGESHTTV